MTEHLARATLLIGQSRYEMAERELALVLAEEPEHPIAHAYLALCLSERGQGKRALAEARLAVGVGPDMPLTHYMLAAILNEMEDGGAAEEAIREAIRLDPEDADHFAILAAAKSTQKQWQEVVDAADQGLALDPEHTSCINFRAHALTMLGRTAEAGVSLETALRHDPHSSSTHANRGWQQLHEGNHQGAMESFREALRLNPGSGWARDGIIEALKARNPIYRVMLRYFLWMSRLGGRAKWLVVLGAFFGFRIVRSIARSNPGLEPFLQPLIILYLVFVFMTWISRPLFNLLLRLHPIGRHALSAEQVRAANLVGGLIAVSLAGFGAFIAGFDYGAVIGVVVGFMLFPLTGYYEIRPRRRRLMLVYLLVLILIGCMALGASAATLPWWKSLLLLYVIGAAGSTWVVNAIMIRG